MAGGVVLGLWIFWSIALLVLYHKVFVVYYFDLGQGIMKELVMSCILGLIMTIVTLAFWYIAAAIIVLFGLGMMKKTDSKVPLVIAVIAAIIVCVVGITLKPDDNAEDAQSAKDVSYTNVADQKETDFQREKGRLTVAGWDEYRQNYVVVLSENLRCNGDQI